MFALNYEGLRKRETYNEIINYLMNKQEKIKMPNRLAKQLRESPQLSNLLDGDGEGALDIEQQQRRVAIEIEKEHRIREAANEDGGGPTERRAFQRKPRENAPKTAKGEPEVFAMDVEDFKDDLNGAIDFFNNQVDAKPYKINEKLKEFLASQVPQGTWAPKAPGVCYSPGEAASSSPPPARKTPLAITHGESAPAIFPSRKVVKPRMPRAQKPDPPKSLMNAVPKPTPIKPNLVRHPSQPKFNIGKSTPKTKEEKADEAQRKRTERTIKKNVERVRQTLKTERGPKTKLEEQENNLKETSQNTKGEPTRTRSIRRKTQ